MPKMYNVENNISVEVNLIDNDFTDIHLSRHDYENWIPFDFILKTTDEEFIYDAEIGSTFSLFEIKKLIQKCEQIVENKLCNKSFDRFEFSACECYFDIIISDPFEKGEVEIELWINMGEITNGNVYGYDKGFRFDVNLGSFKHFTKGLKIQLNKIVDIYK